MREPDLHRDGWTLLDGEERNREHLSTFLIPELEVREGLQRGDYAKLMFQFSIEGKEDESVERMWVIITSRTSYGYLGVLNNTPTLIGENADFWLGTEMPFRAKHIIDAQPGDERSLNEIEQPPVTPWAG